MNVAGELPSAVSGSPKDVGAGWTDNGRTGVLRDHQTVKAAARLFIGERQVGVDEKGRAVDMQCIVDSDGAPRRQRYPLGANRLALTRGLAKVGWRPIVR